MVKECWVDKKEQETWTCFKCDKKGHIAKDCKMKKRKVQEESDDENNKKEEQGFGEDLE